MNRSAPASVVAAVVIAAAGPSTVTSSWARADANTATHLEWGSTNAFDTRLLRGCHPYRYDYRLTPPSPD